MKTQTHSYYEAKVRAALALIVHQLDEALDLTALAERAALSPLHFHRIFRGMVGETPLELHRRLRLERAAARLASSEAPVTSVAFDAGYETHESFTRAFRAAYGMAPTEFRAKAPAKGATRDLHTDLPARIPIHHRNSATISVPPSFLFEGVHPMKAEVQAMPALRVASLSHRGPYNTIGDCFGRLDAIAGPAGLFAHPGAMMIATYHDDPDTTPAAELRSDAGIIVPESVAMPNGLQEIRIAAGDYARATHIGPYAMLGEVWARLMGQWLPASGRRMASGVCYELYRNNPGNARPEALHTDLYVPLE